MIEIYPVQSTNVSPRPPHPHTQNPMRLQQLNSMYIEKRGKKDLKKRDFNEKACIKAALCDEIITLLKPKYLFEPTLLTILRLAC